MAFELDESWPQADGGGPRFVDTYENRCPSCEGQAITCLIHPDGDYIYGCRDCLRAVAHPDREKAFRLWAQLRRSVRRYHFTRSRIVRKPAKRGKISLRVVRAAIKKAGRDG